MLLNALGQAHPRADCCHQALCAGVPVGSAAAGGGMSLVVTSTVIRASITVVAGGFSGRYENTL